MLVNMTVLYTASEVFNYLLKEEAKKNIKSKTKRILTRKEKIWNQVNYGHGEQVGTSKDQKKLKSFG